MTENGKSGGDKEHSDKQARGFSMKNLRQSWFKKLKSK